MTIKSILSYHQLFGQRTPLLYYPIQQTSPCAEVRVWQATHRLPRLAVVDEDVTPGMLQGVILQLGAGKLSGSIRSSPPHWEEI